jgi:hypothetical protein
VPVNPYTGLSVVRQVETFPPQTASNGGWVYHQATGRIAADLEQFLDK